VGAVAFVAERRLMKVLRRRGEVPEPAEPPTAGGGAELATAPEDVRQQAQGQPPAENTQHRSQPLG
jgi:hypothetical protein